MFNMIHIPHRLLVWNRVMLVVGLVSSMIYLAELALGFSFERNYLILVWTLFISVLAFGIFLFVVTSAALYENFRRRNGGEARFVVLNRFGSWQDTGFTYSQLINFFGWVIGIAILVLAFLMASRIVIVGEDATEKGSPMWRQCQSDEECIFVLYPCAGGVVNRRYRTEATEYFSDLHFSRNCAVKTKVEPMETFCSWNGYCKMRFIQSSSN